MVNSEHEIVKNVCQRLEISYRYSYGNYLSRFFQEIRDYKRIWGTKCPKCGGVMVPPQQFCSSCFVATKEWVVVKDTGRLKTFAIVYIPFVGQVTEPPYIYAEIVLDGSNTSIIHTMGAVEIDSAYKKLAIGSRVRAVWKDERIGSLRDILYFELILQGVGCQ